MSIEGFTTKELSDIGEMCDSKCSAVTALPKSSSGHEPLNVSQQIRMCATAVKGVSNIEVATFFFLIIRFAILSVRYNFICPIL